jgi:hypothetical protein
MLPLIDPGIPGHEFRNFPASSSNFHVPEKRFVMPIMTIAQIAIEGAIWLTAAAIDAVDRPLLLDPARTWQVFTRKDAMRELAALAAIGCLSRVSRGWRLMQARTPCLIICWKQMRRN